MRDMYIGTEQHQRGVRVALFFICALGCALAGGFGAIFSGVLASNLTPFAGLKNAFVPLVYVGAFFVAGVNLYLLITTQALTRARYYARVWALFLWTLQFSMALALPFIFYGQGLLVLSFVWTSVLCGAVAALVVLSLRLHFLGGVLLIIYLGWLIFCAFTALFALIG